MPSRRTDISTSWRSLALLTLLGWIVLVAIRLLTYPAPPATTQRLLVELPATFPAQAEPLVAVGKPQEAEVLFLRYLGPERIAIGYDRWGAGGPVSAPIPVTPGERLALEITMPSLAQAVGHAASFTGPAGQRLEVKRDGQTVLSHAVAPLPHGARFVWFGRNPLGGSVSGPDFSGRLFTADGERIAAGGRPPVGWSERLASWRQVAPGESVALLGCVLVLALLFRALRGTGWASFQSGARRHAWFLAVVTAGTVVFGVLITSGTRDLVYHDGFGDFYDYQARSLLQGRLDVPERGISLEAFIHEGRYYGYFGPTPALLRLPFLVFDVGFGQLTRPFMIAAWILALVGAYGLLRQARALLGAPGRRWTMILFVVSVGLGSTLYFLGNRAYVYHEAILWGAAFGLWALYAVIRYALAPNSRWWLAALALGVLSLHARPPTGLHALAALGCVALLLLWRAPGSRARAFGIGVAAFLGIISFNALSYAKFDTWEGCPLRLNVQYNAKRLAVIDGKQFHAVNLPFNASTYFLSPNLFIQPTFPWLLLNVSKPGPEFRGVKIDYAEKTLAVPYAMTSLVLLSGVSLLALRHRRVRPVLATQLVAVLPMTLAMLVAVAVTQRYTADFVPFLVVTGAFGAAMVERFSRRWRVIAGTLLTVATLWAVVLNLLFAIHYQGVMVWGIPPEARERYFALKAWCDARVGRP